jgi:hypothetical protein
MDALFKANDLTASIPQSDWLRFAILLLVLLSILQAVRLVSRVNRSVLVFVFAIGSIGLMTGWVRNRNEPSFLTPVVEVVAPWFPSQLQSHGVSAQYARGGSDVTVED